MLLGCCGAVLGLPALAAAGALLPAKYQIPFSGKSYRQFVNGSDDLFVSTEHKYTHGPSLWGAVGGPITLEEPTAESVFSGIGTFGHLPYADCWNQPDLEADLLIMGAPYDIGTSYRPGARFGPAGIRTGSKRVFLYGGYNVPLKVNPLRDWMKIYDCGDVAATPYDRIFALKQLENGHRQLLNKKTAATFARKDEHGNMVEVPSIAKDKKHHPRVITLGGDHTISLPLMRSIVSVYGPISVIHFDSHLDTWKPTVFGGSPSEESQINHGTYWHWAAKEGLVANGTSIHAGIRTTLSGLEDYAHDAECGFKLSEAREIDEVGTAGIIQRIKDTVGDRPVYFSLDIDVLDPSAAPATGTPETGGWSTRELRTILRGLEDLNIVAFDLVEVAPAYDNQAEVTQQAAADVIYEVMSMMSKAGPLKVSKDLAAAAAAAAELDEL